MQAVHYRFSRFLLCVALLPATSLVDRNARAQTRLGLDFSLDSTVNWTNDVDVRLRRFQSKEM